MDSVDITEGQKRNKKRGIDELNSTIDNSGILTNCSLLTLYVVNLFLDIIGVAQLSANTEIASSNQPTINDIYNAVIKQFSLGDQPSTRVNLNDLTREPLDLRCIGQQFEFVNREKQCMQLIEAIGALDDLRSATATSTTDMDKSLLNIPLVTGIPG